MTRENLQQLQTLLDEFINSPVKDISKVRAGQVKIDVILALTQGIDSESPKAYNVVSDYDGNDTFQVEGRNCEEAAYEALNALGWRITQSK